MKVSKESDWSSNMSDGARGAKASSELVLALAKGDEIADGGERGFSCSVREGVGGKGNS